MPACIMAWYWSTLKRPMHAVGTVADLSRTGELVYVAADMRLSLSYRRGTRSCGNIVTCLTARSTCSETHVPAVEKRQHCARLTVTLDSLGRHGVHCCRRPSGESQQLG